jgi:NAD(P)-dependent dehydrogenase (short-subunit alcohol dehydrogenase family)
MAHNMQYADRPESWTNAGQKEKHMRLSKNIVAAAATAAGALFAMQALRQRHAISFYGQSVVVIGGSRGLGLVIARELAAEGADLTIMARDTDEVERAAQDLSERGARVLALRGDVRDQNIAQEAIDRAVAHYGRVDVLINGAGVIQTGPVEHMTVQDFEDAMAVHLWGPLYATMAVLPHMRRQGGGRIVNISSVGGKVAVPHLLPYCTSKFALVGFSDGMRAELAKDNILVTTVCPGLMRTGSHLNALFKGQHRREFTWFSLLDALPISSIDAVSAARQIVEACRAGAPQLIVSPQAKMIVYLSALFPGLTATGMRVMNRLLPGPANTRGDFAKTGWESQSALAPSILTRLADQATEENNGLRGNNPVL